MTTAQFIHVAQFYETILCFAILVLIGQRFIMMIKDLDAKYLKARAKQFDDQIDWEKSFTKQQQIINQEQEAERKIQEERRRLEEQRQRERDQNNKQSSQPPKQANLRTSLVENENDRTDRKMMEDQQMPARLSIQKRKSLTDLRKSQQLPIDIKDQITSKKSDSSDEKRSEQRKVSDNNVKAQEESDQQNVLRNKTVNLQGSQSYNPKGQNKGQNQINPQEELTQQDRLQKQYKEAQRIKYFIRIDSMFNEYIPILMSALVIGILSHSTYIFTMVCFFGYLFTSLLFNYANLLSKLKNQPTQSSIFSKANKLIAGLFIIGLFANYWFDTEF